MHRSSPTRPLAQIRPRSVFLFLAMVGMGLATGCQRVGVVPPPPYTPAPQPAVVRPEAIPSVAGGGVRTGAVSPLEVGSEVDLILHSVMANDPRLEERIEFWVNFWTTRGSGHFSRYLERMTIYEHVVEAELDRRGLPRSLKYLPIVESGYLEVAVSRAGATGLWQLMAPTATGLGLTVNPVVDDRRDPVASTQAAVAYLDQMHRMFGSWFLALAAYNAGPGRIRGIVNRHADGRPLDDRLFLDLRAELPAETRDFVPRFFAAARIAQSPERYGLSIPATPPRVFAYDEVVVPDATSVDVVAWAAGVEESEVRNLNPQLLRGFTPVGQSRVVRVPRGTGREFERAYALIPQNRRVSFSEHRVARGETLGGIAGQYGVRLADLQAANPGVDPRRMRVGQALVIPVPGAGMAALASLEPQSQAPVQVAQAPLGPNANSGGEVSAAPAPAALENGGAPAPAPTRSATSSATRHRVASGETLSGIARRYGVTVQDLERWNDRSARSVLRVGEELQVAPVRNHRVASGDTWIGVARQYGVSTAELAAANRRTPSDVLRLGEVIRIP